MYELYTGLTTQQLDLMIGLQIMTFLFAFLFLIALFAYVFTDRENRWMRKYLYTNKHLQSYEDYRKEMMHR